MKPTLPTITDLIAQDPKAGLILIVDQLNTHQSESLVRLVATQCQLCEDLGIKGKLGILESMASRAASSVTLVIGFALSICPSIPLGSIRLNAGLAFFRRLLRRGNFTSTDELKQQILKFIDYFNRALANPFLWKFKGFDDCTGWLVIPASLH